ADRARLVDDRLAARGGAGQDLAEVPLRRRTLSAHRCAHESRQSGIGVRPRGYRGPCPQDPATDQPAPGARPAVNTLTRAVAPLELTQSLGVGPFPFPL